MVSGGGDREMRGRWLILGLMLLPQGCVPAVQERVRDYNLDGVYLYQRGDYRDARDCFLAALALQPGDVGLLYNVGQCYDHLGDVPRAEHHYRACLEQSPNHAPCRHALAALLVRDGRWKEAVAMVEDWLTREPKLAAAHAEDGWLWHQAGDLPRAQARLQQALDLDPHDSRALVELALVYETMHRPERAAALYERCLEHNPDQPDIAQRLNRLRVQGVGPPRPD
jgi:tetratricopeptide (TPR) repeat protein